MKRIYGMAMLAALFVLAARRRMRSRKRAQGCGYEKTACGGLSAGLKQMTLVRMEAE